MRRLLSVLLLLPAAVAAPAAAQAPAAISLDLQKVGTGERAVTFAGKAFRVRGTVTPFAAGQRVRIGVYRDGRLLAAKTKPIVPAGAGGQFVADFRVAVPGALRVVATHAATPEMAGARARSERLDVIRPALEAGDAGHSVRVMQRLLRDRGYVVGRRGVYDAATARAVQAFRKMSGLARTFTASRTVLRRMINGGGRFRVRFPGKGRHVEADLTNQVLALIDGGKVQRLYTMSSGKPSTPTVLGSWRVYYRIAGLSPKGLVYPSFFIRGYAVHGWKDVPPYPASAGCLRIPVPDAISVFRWIRMGTWVSTYYRDGRRRSIKPSANAGP